MNTYQGSQRKKSLGYACVILSAEIFKVASGKRKINQNDHSLSFVVTRYHSLPLVVPLVVTGFTTRCHRLYHSLSVVIIGCITRLSFYKRLIYSTIVSKYDGSKLHANPFIAEYSECSTSETKGWEQQCW